MIQYHLIENIWLTASLWAAVYISDYYTTIYSARLYRSGAHEHIVFQGSIELTPVYQKDVDRLRKLSIRFIFFLLLTTSLLIGFWFLSVRFLKINGIFTFFTGSLFLLEAAVHLRHYRNIFLFRQARDSDAIKGTLEYSRRLSLRQSATELFAYAVFFLLLAVGTGSWFFLGGAFGCLATARKHWALSRKFEDQESNLDMRMNK